MTSMNSMLIFCYILLHSKVFLFYMEIVSYMAFKNVKIKVILAYIHAIS